MHLQATHMGRTEQNVLHLKTHPDGSVDAASWTAVMLSDGA